MVVFDYTTFSPTFTINIKCRLMQKKELKKNTCSYCKHTRSKKGWESTRQKQQLRKKQTVMKRAILDTICSSKYIIICIMRKWEENQKVS